MAGDYDAGEDDFGDALPSPDATLIAQPLAALFFDPATRRHALRTDGTFVYIHQVDARVINALNIAREKFAAVKDTGAAFWKLGSAFDPRAKRKVEDWARQALAALISAGDITLEGVELEVVGSYSMQITVSYLNRRLYPFTTQTASVRL